MNKVIVYELKENETWDDAWDHLGIFESKELAEQFRNKRIEELKKDFDHNNPNAFEDWYRWRISPRNLYKKPLNQEAIESINRLKSQTSKDKLDQYGEWKIEYIEDLATICDLYFEENPEIGKQK